MEPSVYIEGCELGQGVFAKRYIAEGEEFLVLEGGIISFKETQRKGETEANPVQIGDDEYLDVIPPGRYLNHSCNPNAGIVRDRILVALQDIAAGEEVRIDYSTTMQEDSWTMACRCGKQDCRGNITDFRLLPKALQERYLALGIVQKFISSAHSLRTRHVAHDHRESIRVIGL